MTSLPAGTYILTLTDSLNASLVDTVELVEPDQLTTELWTWGDVSEYGGSDGVVDVGSWGGNPPYTVLWSTGQEGWMLVHVPAGLYWVISTDANGCQATDSVILNQPPGPLQVIDLSSPKHNGYEISCHGGHDGSIDLTVSGGQEPYSFQWSNGNFTEDINNLIAGDYSVMVTDANFVKFVAYITLTEPNENAIHLLTISYPNGFCTSCSSCTDGSITASDSGGVTPWTYLWSTGQTGTVINSLGRGIYSVTVTDGNGCTASQSVELSAELEVWKIRGNSGIDTATQFIGTTDSKDLIFKTDNVERLTIKGDGSIKISPRLADDYNSTYVDVNGVLRVGVYDNGQNPPNCNQPFPVWFRDVCQSAFSGKVYTYPSNLILGIGTTNPLAKLDVAGGIRSNDLAGTSGFNVAYTNTDGILKKLSPPATSPALNVLHGDGTWGTLPSGASAWIYNGTTIYNDPLSAKVGIGTQSPQAKLQIDHDNANGGIILNRVSTATSHSEIKLNQSGTEKWAIGNDLTESGSNNFFIWNHTRFLAGLNGTAVFIDANNNVGIDKSQPAAKLDVLGNINAVKNGANTIACGSYDAATATVFCENSVYGYGLGVDASGKGHIYGNYNSPASIMTFTTDGAVGINFDPGSLSTRNAEYRLYVEGNIAAREIKVTATTFPDYVFKKGYPLISINDLKKFIDKNNHLPGIPSAKNVSENNGIELGQMQTKFLEKLEEQSLYIISLQEQIDFLKNEIKSLKK